MNRRSWSRAVVLLIGPLLALVVGGCWDDSLFDGNSTERLTIIEDPVLLDQRIEYLDEALSIVPGVLADGSTLPVYADNHDLVSMKLLAEVKPPVLGGVTLQATHLALRNSRAYVSYNVAGSDSKGAIDAFDRINGRQPVLQSGVLFGDTDVSAVDFRDGQTLYLATGVLEGAFPSTAALELVGITNGGRKLSPNTRRFELPSFVATGVAWSSDRVFVTTGDGGVNPGGLSIFDDETMALLSHDPFPDARAVAIDEGRVVAMKGSPAELRVYDESDGTFLRQIFVGGATIPESKSGLAIEGRVAAVAVGEDGVRLVELVDGEILGDLALPDIPNPDGDVVANAVAIHDEFLFVATGAGGLWVAEASDDIEDLRTGRDPGLHWVGSVQFSGQTSINFVARRNKWLVAAGGIGGLKIIGFDD
ncbi:MAG: hypothetical protein ACR2QM_17390 [Longimicrobiales bacterium]